MTTEEQRAELIDQWGVLGSAWGVNRTMAQIHALLMVSPKPLDTDAVMEALKISRGNANTNLRELVHWGLLKVTRVPGERKEFFEAEKDVWKMFCAITQERKRREVDPILRVLEECGKRPAGSLSDEDKCFYEQIDRLREFVNTAGFCMDKISKMSESKIVPKIMKVL